MTGLGSGDWTGARVGVGVGMDVGSGVSVGGGVGVGVGVVISGGGVVEVVQAPSKITPITSVNSSLVTFTRVSSISTQVQV